MLPDLAQSCELCDRPGGEVVWEDPLCRVVRVGIPEAADYPGFCRVIWHDHRQEMTDLSSAERRHLMAVVFATESALRHHYRPQKINLASLGNVVPHVHWHVIPRYIDDRHFPASVWSKPERNGSPTRPIVATVMLQQAIIVALSEAHGGGLT